jgi:hypothetical protein
MKVNLANTSTLPLTHIVKIALPKGEFTGTVKYPVLEIDPSQITPMYLESGNLTGGVTDIFNARVTLPGNSRVSANVKESNGDLHKAGSFTLSPWAALNPAGNCIRAIVELSDGSTRTLWFGNNVNHTGATNNTQSFEIFSHVVDGWLMKQYITAFSDLDHLEFALSLNWHDQSNPGYAVTVRKITLECNSEFRVYYQNAMGLAPTRYSAPIDTWSLDIVPSSTQFRDGQGFEIRGVVFMNPENMISSQTYANKEISRRLSNLNAIKSATLDSGIGLIYGVCADSQLSDTWFNKLPKLAEFRQSPKVDFTYSNPFASPSLFGERRIGMTKTPRQSGAQEDFGADKGFGATVFGNPLWIPMAIGGMTMGMRWHNVHRPDGSKVTKGTNPGRITWNLETFDPLSTDFLGKSKWAPRPAGTGFESWDNQHRSMNLETSYLALTGDPLTAEQFRTVMEADMQQAKNLDLSDREVGRTFQTWARMLRLLGGSPNYSRFREFIEVKLQEFFQFWRGRLLNGSTDKVKCSQIIIDPRSGIVNPITGRLEPSWICYQHAQMISGLYYLYTVLGGVQLLNTIKDLCETFVKYGVVKQNSVWYPIIFSRYITGLESGAPPGAIATAQEGDPIQLDGTANTQWQITLDPGNSGWWDWVSPALVIARQLLGTEKPDIKNRVDEILQQKYPTGYPSIQASEWFPISVK